MTTVEEILSRHTSALKNKYQHIDMKTLREFAEIAFVNLAENAERFGVSKDKLINLISEEQP